MKKAGALSPGFILQISKFYDRHNLAQVAADGGSVVRTNTLGYAIIHIKHTFRNEVVCNDAIALAYARGTPDQVFDLVCVQLAPGKVRKSYDFGPAGRFTAGLIRPPLLRYAELRYFRGRLLQ